MALRFCDNKYDKVEVRTLDNTFLDYELDIVYKSAFYCPLYAMIYYIYNAEMNLLATTSKQRTYLSKTPLLSLTAWEKILLVTNL